MISGSFSAGTSSCKPDNSDVTSGGNMSTRMLRNWPSLVRTPPIWIASWRNLSAVTGDRARPDRRAILRMPGRCPRMTSHQMTDMKTPAKNRTMRR